MDEIKLIFIQPGKEIDILGITETWLNESHSDAFPLIPGYNIERCDRRDGRTGGGVLCHILESIPYQRRLDIESTSDDVECIWIEVCPPKTSSFFV